MGVLNILILISGLSFLAYGIAYFTTSSMKSEFVRFGLGKFGQLTAVLEIMGAVGLMLGIMINSILIVSSGGLAILMLLGVIVRLRVKDPLFVTLPALFYMGLNAVIFLKALQLI
jgi:hypothetical protein